MVVVSISSSAVFSEAVYCITKEISVQDDSLVACVARSRWVARTGKHLGCPVLLQQFAMRGWRLDEVTFRCPLVTTPVARKQPTPLPPPPLLPSSTSDRPTCFCEKYSWPLTDRLRPITATAITSNLLQLVYLTKRSLQKNNLLLKNKKWCKIFEWSTVR